MGYFDIIPISISEIVSSSSENSRTIKNQSARFDTYGPKDLINYYRQNNF